MRPFVIDDPRRRRPAPASMAMDGVAVAVVMRMLAGFAEDAVRRVQQDQADDGERRHQGRGSAESEVSAVDRVRSG